MAYSNTIIRILLEKEYRSRILAFKSDSTMLTIKMYKLTTEHLEVDDLTSPFSRGLVKSIF